MWAFDVVIFFCKVFVVASGTKVCSALEVCGGTKISQLSGGEIDVFYVFRKGGWTSLHSSGFIICLVCCMLCSMTSC